MKRRMQSAAVAFVLGTAGACAPVAVPGWDDGVRLAEMKAAATKARAEAERTETPEQRSRNGAAFKLFLDATALEVEAKRTQALDTYVRSARTGNCFAAL